MSEEQGQASAAPGQAEQTYAFQAEVQTILTLVINSLYTNKEVFLRELVSNASDALDKARFLALTDEAARAAVTEPRIDIRLDEANRTIEIEDSGVGMTRAEVVENLGTIAKSGSLEFFRQHQEAAKTSEDALRLIGQFGVGFYAAFMVADRVDVQTLSVSQDATPIHWHSDGSNAFTVAEGNRTTPGTRILLTLKPDQDEFLRDWRLKDIIRKYSDFVSFPIYIGDEKVSQDRALWALSKADVSEEQHAQFFRHLSGGASGESPLLSIHFSIDAPAQFQALLYIPSRPPSDLFQRERTSLRLYAKRVMIMEECEKLTPVWLRFLRGVVDSEDLSLNVSREMLQDTRTLTLIQQQIVRQVLKSLTQLSEEDAAKYAEFWGLFGKILKEGISVDWKNKDAIVLLCRFETMNGEPGALQSLKQYVEAMKEGQEHIYFITGIGRASVQASPHLEALRRQGYDVLFFTDAIDEWVAQTVTEFEGKKLRSVAHGDIALGGDHPVPHGGDAALVAIQKALGDKVSKVRFSVRLTDSASCLVAEEGAVGANMERIMKMMDERAGTQARILEINPAHPAVENISALAAADPDSESLAVFCQVLYDQALLAEGVVEDPARLTARLTELLTQASRAAKPAATQPQPTEAPATKAED